MFVVRLLKTLPRFAIPITDFVMGNQIRMEQEIVLGEFGSTDIRTTTTAWTKKEVEM